MLRDLCATALLVFAASVNATPSAPTLPPRVDAAIQQRLRDGEFPALVVAVVNGDRSRIYAYGKLVDGKAPNADTVFEIGSVTKTFTATLLAQQVTEGHLKLAMPVASLLPDFSVPSRNGKSITLGNLAEQHSGLPRMPDNFAPADPDNPFADYDGAKLRAFLAHYTLTRDPGSAYEYSNLGVGLLGYALAQHAQMAYGTLLKQRIFGPLGMRSSALLIDASMRAHLATGHDETGKPVANWDMEALAGAGAIKSSAADMVRYLQANMGQLKTPLYPAMQLAHKPRMTVGPEQIGLVWMTRHDASGDVIWHNGMTGGYASFVGFSADGKHGVVVLTNIQQSVDDLGFAALLPNAKLAPPHKRIAMAPKAMNVYVGSYQLAPQFILKVFPRGDQLFAQATGQGALPIFPSATDEFFAKIGGISISFHRNKTGDVVSLTLHQHGDHPAPRVDATGPDAAATGQHAISLSAAAMSEYVGRYRLGLHTMFNVTLKSQQLMVQLTGQSAFPAFASARDKFFLKVVDAQIDFRRDARGKVDGLVLHQAGTNQHAVRVETTPSQ